MNLSYISKIIALTLTIFMMTAMIANAESLFSGGVSYYSAPSTPKSLFSTIRATNIGDLVTIVISEKNIYDRFCSPHKQ